MQGNEGLRKYEERRQTRVVFPNGNAQTVWGIIATLITAWILWISSSILDLKIQSKTIDKPVARKCESIIGE